MGVTAALWHTRDGSTVMRNARKPEGKRMSKIREFLYGMYAFEFERQAIEMRGELESVFIMLTLGDMLGVPIIPPIYSLRVLPYVVPSIQGWKRRMVRERDLADKEEFHLHGV
jgi:hypothetical protein